MKYRIEFTESAIAHLKIWGKSGQKSSVKKIFALIEELREHPTTGTGQVEQLRGNLAGLWSRRIDKANRLVYSIEEDRIVVTIVSLRGHY